MAGRWRVVSVAGALLLLSAVAPFTAALQLKWIPADQLNGEDQAEPGSRLESGATSSAIMAVEDRVTEVREQQEEEAPVDFGNMQSMLHWAIGHSDPNELHRQAHTKKTLAELEQQRQELKEVMDLLRLPSDAELMTSSISVLTNETSPDIEREQALQELLYLVEPIDNANDLHKLGGLEVLAGYLSDSIPSLQTTAAWALGTAASNNPLVQGQILELGILGKLLQMVDTSDVEGRVKGLFAISAVTRNNPAAVKALQVLGGMETLRNIILDPGKAHPICMLSDWLWFLYLLILTEAELRLKRKVVSLLADWLQDGSLSVEALRNDTIACAFVHALQQPDWDLREKSLLAIQLLVEQPMHEQLFAACPPASAIEQVQSELTAALEENGADFNESYMADLHSLCSSVLRHVQTS
eukprot:jgi/Chlat1/7917/Chrsp68S07380